MSSVFWVTGQTQLIKGAVKMRFDVENDQWENAQKQEFQLILGEKYWKGYDLLHYCVATVVTDSLAKTTKS